MDGLTQEQLHTFLHYLDGEFSRLTKSHFEYKRKNEYRLADICETERACLGAVREQLLHIIKDE